VNAGSQCRQRKAIIERLLQPPRKDKVIAVAIEGRKVDGNM